MSNIYAGISVNFALLQIEADEKNRKKDEDEIRVASKAKKIFKRKPYYMTATEGKTWKS